MKLFPVDTGHGERLKQYQAETPPIKAVLMPAHYKKQKE